MLRTIIASLIALAVLLFAYRGCDVRKVSHMDNGRA